MADVTNIDNKTLLATNATVVESTPVRSEVIDTGTDVVIVSTTVGPSTVPYFDENKDYVAKPIEDFAEVIVDTTTVTEKLNDAAEIAGTTAADKVVEDFIPVVNAATDDAVNRATVQADRSEEKANNSADSAAQAKDSADRAEIAAALGGVYNTLADAQAAITAGQIPLNGYFNVRSVNNENYIDEGQNVQGVAALTGKSYPTTKALEAINSVAKQDGSQEIVHKILNKYGFIIYRMLADGSFGNKNIFFSPGSMVVPGLKVVSSDKGGLVLQDRLGFYKIIVDNNGNIVGGGGGGGDSEAAMIAARNASNLAYSANVRGQYNSNIQRPVMNLNHAQWYGQSLFSDQECWPALSKVAKVVLDNLMLGDSVRPNTRAGDTYNPVGNSNLNPLKAVVQDPSNPNIINTDAQVAALPPGAANEGEGAVAAFNFFREMWLQTHGMYRDENHRIVVSNGAVNGRTIEQLSKGATPELYQRPLKAAQQVKAIADAQNLSYGVFALCWGQGEWNYNPAYGGDGTKDGYKLLEKQLYKDFVQDHCYGIAGQQKPCAMFTYQTSAGFTVDTLDLGVGMGQWEFTKEEPNAYMVTPSYPFPDKGGHLNPNGSRWMDMQFGKVMHRVLTLGEGWEPLSPIGNTLDNTKRVLYVDFHVPCPPLKFSPTYVVTNPTNYTNKGFRLTDDNGEVSINNVEIVADTVIKISFGRAVVGTPKLWYASRTASLGNGNLQDSDTFIAGDNYVYQSGSGQYPGENIPALIDKPYPLNNWCIAFCIPVNVTEG